MEYSVHDHEVEGGEGPIRTRAYVPSAPKTDSAFLWIHGGGFTKGGLDQRESDAPARTLTAAGHRVRTIDYRLAPRLRFRREVNLGTHPHRFPAAHHDVQDVAAALAAECTEPISVGGSSSGANLAVGAALALRDQDRLRLRSLVLAYGTFHAELPVAKTWRRT